MPRPIRILHVVDSLGKGGLENGLANLIERMDPSRFERQLLEDPETAPPSMNVGAP